MATSSALGRARRSGVADIRTTALSIEGGGSALALSTRGIVAGRSRHLLRVPLRWPGSGLGGHGPECWPSSAERRDHLGREPLELLGVVEERVEQDQLGAGVRDRAHAGDARLGWASEQVF